MNSILVSYNLIWRFKNYHYLQISKCRKVFNIKTGKQRRLTVNGGSIGLWVTPKKFIVKSELNTYIEQIPKKEYTPF